MKSEKLRLKALERTLLQYGVKDNKTVWLSLKTILEHCMTEYFNSIYSRFIECVDSANFNNTVERRQLTEDLHTLASDESKDYIILRRSNGIGIMCEDTVHILAKQELELARRWKTHQAQKRKLKKNNHLRIAFDNVLEIEEVKILGGK